ncbi:MAG: cytochrome c biogenesis protein, partial [Planctomycetes bacterium]|nr:cytochrome c biogenesis protein [Planctomycetota bacterium]
SCWARIAWNKWWIWYDPRLLSAAFMWLVYVGYVVVQTQMEPGAERRRWAAVLGVLAFVNVPIVHFAIQWLGEKSHPQEVGQDSAIRWTAGYGVLAFFAFYSLVYRWKLAGERARDRLLGALASLRRLEEGALS